MKTSVLQVSIGYAKIVFLTVDKDTKWYFCASIEKSQRNVTFMYLRVQQLLRQQWKRVSKTKAFLTTQLFVSLKNCKKRRKNWENVGKWKSMSWGGKSHLILLARFTEHNAIRLGNYKGQPIAVGGWYTRSVEVMSLKSDINEWSFLEELPCDGENCNR